MFQEEAEDIGYFADVRFWILETQDLVGGEMWTREIRVCEVKGFLQVGLLVTSKQWSKYNEIRSALLEAETDD